MREPAAQAKQGHGNVKAQSFIAPHKPLDETAQEYLGSDWRVHRAVRRHRRSNFEVARSLRLCNGYSLTVSAESAHVEALSSALAAYGKKVRDAIHQSDELGDKHAADIFTEILSRRRRLTVVRKRTHLG